ncbi:MAG: hypothetical protein JOZ41_03225 [Chloroflexi bacterium]|nr:hypothetical protein [Chloroflexota bacterium]
MAGLSQEDFDRVSKEIQSAWAQAQTRDAGFQVIVDYGRKYGYKNVIAAIQNRMPKRFTREKPLTEWMDERQQEEQKAES